MNHSFLNSTYSRNQFIDFVKNFLPDFTYEEASIEVSSNSLFKTAQTLGHALDGELTILEVTADPMSAGKRIAITKEAFSILRDHGMSNALIAFDDGQGMWRLSLLTTTLKLNDKGKVTSENSNPRRYSYLLGVGAKTVTPHKYLVEKGRVAGLESLRERFSVEVVNNDFYRQIAKLYDELVGTEDVRSALSYPDGSEAKYQFAVRLVGRIVFCWFLREKQSTGGLPLIGRDLMSLEASHKSNYYHEVLAPLFFETLNRPIGRRVEKFATGSFGKVPYLNGGLFAPQFDDYYKFDRNMGMSVPSAGLSISDSWIRKLFELLETYNFTVDENTSIDVDLSIDPEMLGRIFENLLARINPETGETVRKSTGSFYTPREIVDYMVDESLVQYLKNKTYIEEIKLRALVSYNVDDDSKHPLNFNDKLMVVKALGKVRILDPACGSGAFPIGILQKIVFILQQVDPDTKLWLENQLAGASIEFRRELEKQSFDYIRKSEVIRKSIFGVDIQPIATEIARLRCFLTLIVDENIDDSADNRGIKVLPNLDFKFVTANSLIKAPGDNNDAPKLFDSFEEQLGEAVDEYFSAEGSERAELSHKLRDLIDQKVNENKDYVLNNSGIIKDDRFVEAYNQRNARQNTKLLRDAQLWDSYKNIFTHQPIEFYETKYIFPSAKEGFDIVIGNPPYLSTEKIKDPEKSIYKETYSEIHASRTDIYAYFYYRGMELTRPETGILCYITSNKWMRAGYGQKLREYFTNKNPFTLIDFGGFKVFESATVDTNIFVIQNSANNGLLRASHFKNDYKKGQSIKEYFDTRNLPLSTLTGDPWFIGDENELKLKEKISISGVPLRDWNVTLSRGIITGLNEAYVIDDEKRTQLIKEDINSSKIIKSLFRGRNIKKYWHEKHTGAYIILVGYGMYKSLEDEYPAIYRHLRQYEEKLRNRGQCKGTRSGKRVTSDFDGQHHWLELDNNPSQEYFNLFEQEKIVWSDIAKTPSFEVLPGGLYINNTAYMINGAGLDSLLGVLNSSLMKWLFPKIATDLGDGGVRYFKQFVELIPVPIETSENTSTYTKLAATVRTYTRMIADGKIQDKDVVEKQIDQLVYELYDLTPEEIQLIEESAKS